MSIIVGLDPSSGRSGSAAIACFDSETLEIYFSIAIAPLVKNPKKAPIHWLLHSIAEQLTKHIKSISKLNKPVRVYCEDFVMKGKSGQTLAHGVGAMISRIPPEFTLAFVHNTNLKLIVAGKGDADKQEVADGVIRYFKKQGASNSAREVQELANLELYDQTDAFAIAIAGEFNNARTR